MTRKEEALAKRLVQMLAAMIPAPPEVAPKTRESRIILRLGEVITASLPPEGREIVGEIIDRLVRWGIVAVESSEDIRRQVGQKLIEFAMLVAEEYADNTQ